MTKCLCKKHEIPDPYFNSQADEFQLLQTLDESLFANLDVTEHEVSWNVIRIAQHVDIQQSVRSEIRICVDTETPDDSYEAYLRREYTLLAACIVEASRLHPVLRKKLVPSMSCHWLT